MAFSKTLILLCLLIVLPTVNARAQFKGLFLMGEIQQSIVADYNYSGQELMPNRGTTSSSSQNRFSETYNAGMEYSILHPYVLNGHLKVGLGLDQEMYSSPTGSSSSSGSKYSYDIDGTIFKISPTPANFSVRSETIHIPAPFTPGYDVTTDSYAVGASFKHKILGLRVDYQNTTSETSGTISDSRQSISLLTLKADNTFKNSTTELQVIQSTSSLEPLTSAGAGVTKDVSYNFTGKNTLISSLNDKTLSSSVSYREERQTATTKTFVLGESLLWQLGKALTLGASYENSSVSTSGGSSEAQTSTRQQTGSVSLTHLLLKSLSTRLKVQGRLNDRTSGSESEYTGSANFCYTKKLSAADSLTLNYSEEHSVVDRNFSSGIQTADKEPLTIQTFQFPGPGENRLQQQNIISIISLCDQAKPLSCYDQNDYALIPEGPFSRLDFSVIGSRIAADNVKTLLISYRYTVDAKVKYLRVAHGGGGAVTFYNGTYQVYTNVSQSTQEITSGQAGILLPSSSLDFLIGATRNKNGTYAEIVYVNSDSAQIKNQYIEGTFRLTRNFEASSINAQAKDRQTWYGVTSYNTSAHTENQLSLSADYARNVFRNGVLTLRVIYLRTVDTSRQRNDGSLESIYRWGSGKLFLEASGKVLFRDTDGDSALDNQVHLRITRNF